MTRDDGPEDLLPAGAGVCQLLLEGRQLLRGLLGCQGAALLSGCQLPGGLLRRGPVRSCLKLSICQGPLNLLSCCLDFLTRSFGSLQAELCSNVDRASDLLMSAAYVAVQAVTGRSSV